MDQQEVNTLIECFQVPEKDRKLRYMNSLGDGDLKSFLEIPNLGIYAQILVKTARMCWLHSKNDWVTDFEN